MYSSFQFRICKLEMEIWSGFGETGGTQECPPGNLIVKKREFSLLLNIFHHRPPMFNVGI